MRFEQVLGQSELKKMLTASLQDDRLAHSFILLGPSGYGALPLALATAQYLLCTNRSSSDACGQCSSCHKASNYIHPDLHFTFPTIKPKSAKSVTSLLWMKEWRSFLQKNPYASIHEWLIDLGGDNKQGNITRDECVRIVKTLGLKSFEGEYKIQIIWMAEYLAKEGNRLLKLIEEPPPNTIFILIAEQEEKVLNTILSRCQILRTTPVDDDQVKKHLSNLDSKQDEVDRIVRIAKGDVNLAIQLTSEEGLFGAGSWLKWLRILYKGNPLEMVEFSDEFARLGRESQKAFLNYGLHFMHEMIRQQSAPGMELDLPETESIALTKISQILTVDDSFQVVALLEESIYHLERYANTKVLMLDNSIRLSKLFGIKTDQETSQKKMKV